MTSTRKPRPGRTKEYPKRITLPLTNEMLAEIDGMLDDGETRLDLIRDAIDRELIRRVYRPGKGL